LKNIDERSNEVGFIGRLEEEKGIIDFIKLVRLVVIKAKQFKINVSFYVVGNGKLELLVKNTVARFLSEGINIRFHGFIENKLLPNVLNETKILVLPYKSPAEGIPTTILEAFACGTPVIAYDTGLISLIVRNQVTGFVVPRGNYKAVADLILKLLSNQSVLSRISYNQRKFAEASLSFEKAINRYLLLMKRLYSKK
jgi:glycosyltransferase involved in cell wall biosynthesis